MSDPIDIHDGPGTMVVDCAGYENGKRICTLDIQDVREWIARPDRFVWIGLYEPSSELLQAVQQQFGLHDLVVEDAYNARQRPKLEFYGDSIFLVLHTAQRRKGVIEFGETHVFAGRGYVVAVRHGASHSYRELRAKCERIPAMLAKGADFVVYSLMDFVVDNYMPIIDEMGEEAGEIEDEILRGLINRKIVQRVHDLRRNLRTLQNISSPLIETCERISLFESGLIDDDMRPYFRDVRDHLIRIDKRIGALRDLLTSALESNIMLASMEQNEVMKKLAAYAAMLAVPTAIAGIYGMNFEFMPELHWKYGYLFALGVMAGTCAYLYRRFVKAGWL